MSVYERLFEEIRKEIFESKRELLNQFEQLNKKIDKLLEED